MVDLPEWSNLLSNYYWVIRVEGRNRAKRRKYYRYVEKEKLRLSDLGVCQIQIKAVCLYLAGVRRQSLVKMLKNVLAAPHFQIPLNFT